jgi:hypothetical protein
VYEVGICTLQELFEVPVDIGEKNTAAFRTLLREVGSFCSFRSAR